MQPSMFNVRVPLEQTADDVFLMNTFTDAQLLVSPDVAELLDRVGGDDADRSTDDEREALDTLDRERLPRQRPRRRAADARAVLPRRARETPTQLHVTVLTTLQCNFACDYCFQGDHGDYNKFADEDDARDGGAGRRLDRSASSTRVRPEKLRADVLRRRAAAEPAGVYYLAERLWQRDAGARRARCSSTSSPTACC